MNVNSNVITSSVVSSSVNRELQIIETSLVSSSRLRFALLELTANKTEYALLALYLLSQQSKTVASPNSCGYYANVTRGTVSFKATLNTPTVTVAPLLFAGIYTFVVFNPSFFVTAPTDFTMQIQ